MIFGNVLLLLGIIYALILTGMVLKLLIKGVDALTRTLSILLINFLLPVVVFTSITQFNEAVGDLRIFTFSASIFLLSSVVAYLFLRLLKHRGRTVGPFILASVNPNGLYLPFPIVYALHSAEGLSYSTLFLLTANIATVFYVYPLYSYYSSSEQRKRRDVDQKDFAFSTLYDERLGVCLPKFRLYASPRACSTSVLPWTTDNLSSPPFCGIEHQPRR